MSEKRFVYGVIKGSRQAHIKDCHNCKSATIDVYDDNIKYFVDLLNEQQELIEELQVSDEMGWKRAERFEKKCPKELHNKKMYIKRLEYKVQKFKEMNGEQQATIRRLQDLCGESDGENAKLRIENKRLEKEVNLLRPTNIEQYEQIQKLQEENEKLRRLFVEMKQPITIDLTEEDEKELRKLLGLIDDE